MTEQISELQIDQANRLFLFTSCMEVSYVS